MMLKTFLASRTKTEDHISIEQYNKEIDEALDEAASGNYITQEDMVKEVKWPLAAQKQLAKIYRYILSDSYQNAEKVKMKYYWFIVKMHT